MEAEATAVEVKPKRVRKAPYRKWSELEQQQLVDFLRENMPIEKPTAQIFYKRFLKGIGSELDWTLVRCKVKNMRQTYIKAKSWPNTTGAGTMQDGKPTRDTLIRMCPFYDELEEIFGNRELQSNAFMIDTEDSNTTDSVIDSVDDKKMHNGVFTFQLWYLSKIPDFRKRDQLNPTFRWSDAATHEILQLVAEMVKDAPELTFEKPVAQKFYEIVESNSKLLKNASWVCMKNKLRHLKSLFERANFWKQEARGDKKAVLENIKKMCPHYDLLHQIFGHTRSKLRDNELCNNISDPLEPTGFNTCDESEFSDISNFDHTNELQLDSPITISNSKSEKRADKQMKMFQNGTPHSISVMVAMQERKLELEKAKFNWQIEKEKMEMEQKLVLKKLELEMEREKFIIQTQMEEKLRIYELELKYQIKK